MRSGRDIPGRDDPNDAAEPAGPATFPAVALRPALVGIATTVLAAWTVGALLPKSSPPVFLVVYYLVVFGGLIHTVLAASGRWGSGDLRADFGWWARRSDLLRGVVVAYGAAVAGGVAVTFWPDGWTTNAEWLTSADGLTVAVFAAHRWRRLGPGMVAHALTNILVTAAVITG
jgi:hypothetical protein